MRNPLKLLLLGVLRAYQRLLSPMLPPRCRYYPSCSEYAVQAIDTFGILRGFTLAVWRVLRCNPWSRGGVDLVEDQRLFGRGRPPAPETPPTHPPASPPSHGVPIS